MDGCIQCGLMNSLKLFLELKDEDSETNQYKLKHLTSCGLYNTCVRLPIRLFYPSVCVSDGISFRFVRIRV
jgi:hypothetical protein